MPLAIEVVADDDLRTVATHYYALDEHGRPRTTRLPRGWVMELVVVQLEAPALPFPERQSST